jgi:FixJ family two-component response regulator
VSTPTVFIVDDDPAVRDSLTLLCETAGLEVSCHGSAEAFLGAYRPEQPGCLLLDVRMPRMSGPELHEELNRRGSRLPVIYLTAHGDIPMTVAAMKSGAADFLTKPVDGATLLERVEAALKKDHEFRSRQERLAAECRRLASLTEREREIMALAVTGHSNKEIARHLGISFRTVEIHRSHIFQKTATGNLLELVRLAADCGFTAGPVDPADR